METFVVTYHIHGATLFYSKSTQFKKEENLQFHVIIDAELGHFH